MTMQSAKKKKLQAKGWAVGSADDFLELSPEESALIDLKIALAAKVKELRRRKKLSQVVFAKMIESSQSRVAKIEAGDPSVSIDLLVKSCVALGLSRKELGKTIAG